MTNPDYTAIGVVLDRSGSMAGIKSDAEGALNTFIEDQKKEPGKATLTLAQFDDHYELVHDNIPLDSVPPVTLTPRGLTALLDAIGKTVVAMGETFAKMADEDRPGKVLVAIITDGIENASRDWTRASIFQLITQQREKWGWDFVFLAANQDAIAEGAGLGVKSALNFEATGAGVRAGGQSLSNYAGTYRSTGKGRFDK